MTGGVIWLNIHRAAAFRLGEFWMTTFKEAFDFLAHFKFVTHVLPHCRIRT